MSYTRYRFKTTSVNDPRPLQSLKPIGCPYWISGYEQEHFEPTAAIIVCYLPQGTDLLTYWDDAYDITSETTDTITYTDRFPKPDWLK